MAIDSLRFESIGEHFPVIATHPDAKRWIQSCVMLGLAPNTVTAYARAVEEFLGFCQNRSVEIRSASREVIAPYVGDLRTQRRRERSNVVRIDSGALLSNATLQQRLTAVRLFFDFLFEDGLMPINPVGRGRYTLSKRFGGRAERSPIQKFHKLPGYPPKRSGRPCSPWLPRRRRATAACSHWPMMRRCDAKSCVSASERGSRPGPSLVTHPGGNNEESPGTHPALFGHLGGIVAQLSPTSPTCRQHSGAAVPVRIATQLCGADHALDMVQGRQIDCAASRGPGVLDPYPASPVPDRSGTHGLGSARDRASWRPSEPGYEQAVCAPLGA